MSAHNIVLSLREDGVAADEVEVLVAGIPEVSVAVSGRRTTSRPAGRLFRTRVEIDADTSASIRVVEDLLRGALADSWDRWFKTDACEIDDLCVPVVSVDHRDRHTATLLTDAPVPDQERFCLRMSGAAIEVDGIYVVWDLVPDAEIVRRFLDGVQLSDDEPEPAEAAAEPEPDPLVLKQVRAIRRRAERKVSKLLAAGKAA